MFSGSIPALVTPFDADGALTRRPFAIWSSGRSRKARPGWSPCGTTGEAATLTKDEHFEVVRVCVDQAKGRVPVIAGAGSNDTRVAIANCSAAKDAGRRRRADGAALLQPAEPGGHLPPFRGAGRATRRCRSSSTTCPAAPSPTSCRRRWRASCRRSRTYSSASRTPPAQLGRVTEHRPAAAPTSPSCRAMTIWRWPSTRWAGRAASRSPPMSRRGCAPSSRRRGPRAIMAQALALHDRLYPLARRDVHRRLAGPGQICADAGPARLPAAPAPADDARGRGGARRRWTRGWRRPGVA